MKPLLPFASPLRLCLAVFTGASLGVAATAPAATATTAAVAADADGFVPLFNGRDLTGWKNVNCAPETWGVKDGKIVCTGHPIGALRTTKQYENFIVEFEWRHLESAGNSGMFAWASAINPTGVHFLRAIEIQALDHGYAENFERKNGKKADWFTVHGDVFAIQGASMTPIGKTNGKRSFPTEERSKRSPEWNHYRVVANNGSIRLHVNGKEVSGGDNCNYRKGYLGLESEGAPVEFRNLRIKELPSTNAGPDVTAPVDLGWRSLFNGLDFRGWRTNATTEARWSIVQENLVAKSNEANATASAATPSAAPETALWTTEEFGRAEFVIDYQPPKSAKGEAATTTTIFLRGQNGRGTPLTLSGAEPGKFSRFIVTVDERRVRVQREGQPAVETTLPADVPARGALGLVPSTAAGTYTNLHVRDL